MGSKKFTKQDGTTITELSNQTKRSMKREISKKNAEARRKLDPSLLNKYFTGDQVVPRRIKGKRHKIKAIKQEKLIAQAEEESARAELLLTEGDGVLEVEEGTYTTHVNQEQIKKFGDITTASKSFDLNLSNFGPYKFRYTRNGRHIVLGGKMGHLAAFDWLTKKLHYEINVTDSIHDVCYLDNDKRMAVAQKDWVYTYDNLGIETHCLKKLHKVIKMEYLPYHCLLVTGSENSFISYLDITLGAEIVQFPTKKGPLSVMCQNPYNAVMCCGHNNGTVTMWTPNSNQSVAAILCHPHPIRAIAVDPTGKYMATASTDRLIKLWDARKMGECLQSYKVAPGANNLAFSQKGLLAVAMNNVVEVYKDVLSSNQGYAYMKHTEDRTITGLQFCPYEDVLGVSSYRGFCSLVIPGSGNANFDALEANPYISRSGRKEAEIKNLLAKVPSSFITLDPLSIAQVDVPTFKEKLEAKFEVLHLKPPKIDLEPKYRMKGKSGSANKFKRKQRMTRELKTNYIKEMKEKKKELLDAGEKKEEKERPSNPLDRFKPKNKK